MTDAHLTELREIRRLLALLVEQPGRDGGGASPLKPADRRVLEMLLPAIRCAFRDDAWLVRDLFASPDAALQTTLQTIGLDAHRLGKLFKRTAGQCLGDLRVERIGDTRDGALLNVTMVR